MINSRNPELLRYKDILTHDFLKKEYISKKKSILSLSKELNKDYQTIKYYLLFHGIKLRSHKEQAEISSIGGKPKYENILTKEYLTKEYIENKKGIKNLAEELKIYRVTVRRYLANYNIPLRSFKQQINLSYPPKEFYVTEDVNSFIDGLLLGDASVPKRKDGVAPRSLSQACKHREYLEYISNSFSDYGVLCSPILTRWINDERCKNKGYKQSFFQTRRYRTFEEFRRRWYFSGKKSIPRDLILNKEVLLQCYLGDGNFYREIMLCLNAFDKEDILFLKKLIQDELKITLRVVKRNGQYMLAIKKSDTGQFLRYIGSSPVECFRYKWRNNESEEARKRKNLNARLAYYRKKNAKKICNSIS